mmetsp:Transcript_84153/g.212202  ORF Transcript_84153/g.212202 Transcript_84153/m.212202 type:complete len:83 (-) Transcript_84153:370-618(-)
MCSETIQHSKQENNMDVAMPPVTRPIIKIEYTLKCLVIHEAMYKMQYMMQHRLRPNLSVNVPTKEPNTSDAPNPATNNCAIS